ncbi:MAG: type II toxin-antitoxin system RelE/ParE family toxin [Pseudomonadota bacterium]|nr:type II toxin-antitoxin system RelE/ParE family toxin [Halothiobacillaceae bacterium]MDY0050086.1 type II toxin-antitoxin system RelE/ParE family toxin [Halothiobacillaceae bacterium]
MSYQVRLAPAAAEDLQRLFAFLAEHDLAAAERARHAIERAFMFLRDFPFACRKASSEHPFLREMLIEFGSAGYVALYEIESGNTVTILAVRHQREDDYH